jgi:DNA-binding response OmpR family regulator
MTAQQVLVVEDDLSIARSLVRALEGAGYAVALAESGGSATTLAGADPPDLVLLDLGLPDIDGLEVCRRLREIAPGTTIVMLTARGQEIDVVVGLDAGADDYVTKPFSLAELLARIRAHLRKKPADDGAPVHLRSGPIEVDAAARRVSVGGVEISLRPREFDLLRLLVGSAGKVVTREDIMAAVWDENWFGSTKTLDVHMAAVRRKLGVAGGLITTIRGVGYRLEPR